MINVLKFGTLFSFCPQIKWGCARAGIHKMLVRKANGADPDQTASVKQNLSVKLQLFSYPAI